MLDYLRIFLARHLFSLLQGATFGGWWRLLVRHRFAIDPRYWPRATLLTLASLANSAFARLEERRYGRRINAAQVRPPLFILGHYRGGTTHLHNLLSVDPQFAYPTLLQAIYPHTFLTAGTMLAPLMAVLMTRRRPQDNMALAAGSPAEDEFALCVATSLSPYMAWVFPRGRVGYDKYLTFREVPRRDEDGVGVPVDVDKPGLWEQLQQEPDPGRVRRRLEEQRPVGDQGQLLQQPDQRRLPPRQFLLWHLWRVGPPTWQLQRPGAGRTSTAGSSAPTRLCTRRTSRIGG